MFTGIIESMGQVQALREEGTNLHITIQADIANELKVDQSVAHNGVCLTVVSVNNSTYTVTAIKETLEKTNLGELSVGSPINLERAMVAGGRLDGHMVQGHVDSVGHCLSIEEVGGSWQFTFEFTPGEDSLIVKKGSICVDGVSLTVTDATEQSFSVAIIPYTFEHTCFKYLKVGSPVNLEFDIIGKYLAKYSQQIKEG